MTFTVVEPNEQNFSEVTLNDKQPLVTNNLGRDADPFELVYLGGYFGEVRKYNGILDTETGRINIDSNRTIRTEQIEVTDTFTVGNTIWFSPGGSGAAGLLLDADSGSDLAVGIITEEEGAGGAQTSVTFRPFAQRLDAADVSAQVATLQAEMLVEQAEPKRIVQKITSDASTPIAVSGLSVGDEIIGMSVICTAANASGTFVLEDGDGDDITDGIICAVDEVVTYAGTIDNAQNILPASGAQIISVGGTAANTRGIVIIDYIPA